jgi:regulator of protease activity HflC (stomatin/prohibitin superfamily)
MDFLGFLLIGFSLIIMPLFIILITLAFLSIKIVTQYEKGVKFTLGKFSGIMQPGLNIVIPILQSSEKVDVRTMVIDVPKQDIMTRDNISAMVNAVVYYKVSDAKKVIIDVKQYKYVVSQISQTTMREIIGETSLDELLSQRDATAKKIQVILDKVTDPWGIKIESVELKEIILPESLVRIISQEAEAEREKRAILLRAKGELESSKNLKNAAENLTKTKGALHLRTLQTIHALSTENTNTTIYAIPTEIMDIFGGKNLNKIMKKIK